MSYFIYENQKIFYEESGMGEPLLLLHGNTASSRMFSSIIPKLSDKYRVVTIDFLGCGLSDRLSEWPVDLWYQWGEQASALCTYLALEKVNVIGSSGGAIAAINMVLDHPEQVNAVIADSFEGLRADASITEQIRMGRDNAKKNEGFCSWLRFMHGEDWERVLNADTETIIAHAKQIGDFFHKDISALSCRLLLTGSSEDEMFPSGHYKKLFEEICSRTESVKSYIFAHGTHPAMMSNMEEFCLICEDFLKM